ncbi:hypothetical protein N7668_09835 [Pseudomonas fulva]|nr:hypothetical protein [Pseudomonas fulva]MDH0571550.1 hypothetical protein [Pseudomonas fulva]
MDGQALTTADTLELLHLNQIAIRAAIEERSLWMCQRGSVHTHENVMAALATLDFHTKAISSGVDRLRSDPPRS